MLVCVNDYTENIPFWEVETAHLVKKLHGYKNKTAKGAIRGSIHKFCQVFLATKMS